MNVIKRLKKERKQIIFLNIFFLCCLLLSMISIPTRPDIINLGTPMLIGVMQTLMLIAYFDNKKGIRYYEKT